MEYISTSNLAKKHKIDPAQLFDKLNFFNWIERKNDKWILTDIGKEKGGITKVHPQYGEYIAWPETTQIGDSSKKESLISATVVGTHFKVSSQRINLILSELGWIQKHLTGWLLTKQGGQIGGRQFEHETSGANYVLWPSGIVNNINLKAVFEDNQRKDVPGDITKEQNQSTEFRDKFEARLRTQDGHYVRSRAELIIDNLLYQYQLVHAYERKLPIPEDLYCDFYLPAGKVYIEFWGLENDPKYQQRKKQKLDLYKKYELNLIELTESDIENLDDHLPRKLMKFNIKVY